jgi:hypothetical protein
VVPPTLPVCGIDNLVPSIKYKSQYGDADIQPTSAVEMVYASLSQTYQQGSFDVTDEPNTEDIQVKPGVSSHTVDLGILENLMPYAAV